MSRHHLAPASTLSLVIALSLGGSAYATGNATS
jgi:hypothetical protein